MCHAHTTSREHVPPKNLFPEAKDVNGADYRINLITVRSCDDHNTEKSHDDEFLMVSLAGIIGNNSIGYVHRLGKVDRAIRNSAHRLLDQVVVERKAVHQIQSGGNLFYEVIWGTPDVHRLKRCFTHIGFGLHQHHFHTRFSGHIEVLLGYLFHSDHNAKTLVEFIRDRAAIDLEGKPRFGSNQDIFFYQVAAPDQFNLSLMKLVFYGGLEVYLAFIPESVSRPTHLGFELLAHGVKLVISLGDKAYTFEPRGQTQTLKKSGAINDCTIASPRRPPATTSQTPPAPKAAPPDTN